jgi:hypothetical protein
MVYHREAAPREALALLVTQVVREAAEGRVVVLQMVELVCPPMAEFLEWGGDPRMPLVRHRLPE